MPIVDQSQYRVPFLFRNGHVQTVYPSLMRKLDDGFYTRERINTPDDDFLDIDWARIGSNKIAIISHGLEGNSHRPYVVGMASMLNRQGWDALAWNYRGCSGEINRRLRMYHNGSTDDLNIVIGHALEQETYQRVALIGFSLGGNLSLVYLGQHGHGLDTRIQKAVVFSVPCNLRAGAQVLARRRNWPYMQQFLISLHKKIKAKMKIMPAAINDHDFYRIKNFKDFDDRYTAPIHGFKDAEDYWTRCSSAQFIPEITIPTLIVNALDDPFLADGCYPVHEAAQSRYVYLEMPSFGGHVGFVQFNQDKSYWSERRAMEFLNQDQS
jgi:predicted alpha/beta-fold hydrolase